MHPGPSEEAFNAPCPTLNSVSLYTHNLFFLLGKLPVRSVAEQQARMAATGSLPANTLNLDLESGPHAASGLEEKLFSVFVSYVPSESQVTATSAAAQIDSLLIGVEGEASPNNQPRPDPWGFLHTFWDVYFRLGVQVDGSEPMDRLVALVCALKKLPTKVTSSDGQGLVFAWQNLPIMGMELSERWHREFIKPARWYQP